MGCTGNQKEIIQSKILLLRLEKFDLMKERELKIQQLEKLTGEKFAENQPSTEPLENKNIQKNQNQSINNQSGMSEFNNFHKANTPDKREIVSINKSPTGNQIIHLKAFLDNNIKHNGYNVNNNNTNEEEEREYEDEEEGEYEDEEEESNIRHHRN